MPRTGGLPLLDPGESLSAAAFLDPGESVSAAAFLDPGESLSAATFLDPGESLSAAAFLDPGESLSATAFLDLSDDFLSTVIFLDPDDAGLPVVNFFNSGNIYTKLLTNTLLSRDYLIFIENIFHSFRLSNLISPINQIFCKNFANITSNINNTYLTVGTKTIQPINCITCVTFTNHLGTHLIILLPVFI